MYLPDWNLVKVSSGFQSGSYREFRFTRQILRFTVFIIPLADSCISFHTGIYNAWLQNCEVGRNTLIHNVRSYIANYNIGEGVIIHNVTTIAVDGEATFGNGTEVETINECGGRAIPIYDYLSSHIAYILALYRHRPKLISALKNMVSAYTSDIRNSTGSIGAHSVILNCNTILNVKTGPATNIDGAKKLKNGSINSTLEAPVIVGEGVIMDDFIVCSGSRITDATLISKCFVD